MKPALAQSELGRRRFLTCALVLGVMAVGMRPAATALGAWSSKRPVTVRKPLREFDKSKLVEFRYLEDMGVDSAPAVETEEFIEWRLAPTDPSVSRTGVAYLLVHYYTSRGRTPLIPHTPEVCYRQTGNQVMATGDVEVAMKDAGLEGGPVAAKYLRLSHPSNPNNKDICVIYVFCVNGRFHNDRERARLQMALPWNRSVYFTKIECVTRVPRPEEFDVALTTCKMMLARVIPELLRVHLPTAEDIARAEQEEGG